MVSNGQLPVKIDDAGSAWFLITGDNECPFANPYRCSRDDQDVDQRGVRSSYCRIANCSSPKSRTHPPPTLRCFPIDLDAFPFKGVVLLEHFRSAYRRQEILSDCIIDRLSTLAQSSSRLTSIHNQQNTLFIGGTVAKSEE